jgi:pimeloyl-ACP methyl ester carboxylesterase
MNRATVNGVELEYAVKGSGEPVLLIPTGPIADSFHPFFSQAVMAERYQLLAYHRRGQAGSTHSPAPVSFADQAADAAALLSHLGINRAHVAGHSTGGVVALQLAVVQPERVHTLALLEPTLMMVPSAAAFMEQAAPVFAMYGGGDGKGAMAGFISAVCGLSWEECEELIEERVPGGVEQMMQDAETFFGIDLPAHNDWSFGLEQATQIGMPVLSVLGTKSAQVFAEGRQLLHDLLPLVEDCTIKSAGHLLHIQQPEAVARGVAEFFARHPLRDGARVGAIAEPV